MSPGITASFTRRFAEGPVIQIEGLETAATGVTIIYGASGAGKSTLLRCLAGIENPDSGTIAFQGETWFDQSTVVPARSRNVGYVPQQYLLFPHLTVAENVGYGISHLPADEKASRVKSTLELLGLQDLDARLPGAISGGQQQRVALARALIRQPRLLLLDEPLAALDVPLKARLRSELRHILVESKIPSLVVTHDRTEALSLGDQIVVIEAGKIIQSGPVQAVFNRPAKLSVAGILAVETIQSGEVMSYEAGLAQVRAGTATLFAATLPEAEEQPVAAGASVYVCIRAEDVVLLRDRAGQTSARNCLPGVIRNLLPEGASVRVEMDCGFPLVALLTKQGCAELNLKKDDTIYALVKAPHVQLISRE